MEKYKLLRAVGLLGYWGVCIAAGAIFGFWAAVLTVVGTACAAVVLAADDLSEEDEDKCSTDGLDTERATHKEDNQ